MKPNDIGDSYLLWLLERVLSASTQEDDPPTYAGKHSAQPSRMPARQPLEMPDRYRFHSTRPAPWEASQCGVGRRPPVQGRSELQAHGWFRQPAQHCQRTRRYRSSAALSISFCRDSIAVRQPPTRARTRFLEFQAGTASRPARWFVYLRRRDSHGSAREPLALAKASAARLQRCGR